MPQHHHGHGLCRGGSHAGQLRRHQHRDLQRLWSIIVKHNNVVVYVRVNSNTNVVCE